MSKSVRKYDSEPRYKIEFMYQPYDGEYTAEECGKNVEVMLKAKEPSNLYNPHFVFYRTDLDFKASTKKSKSATKSFNDMVKEQRNKNIKKVGYSDYSDFSKSDIENMALMFQYIEDMAKDCKKRGTGENTIIRISAEKTPDEFYEEVREVYVKMAKIHDEYLEYWHN